MAWRDLHNEVLAEFAGPVPDRDMSDVLDAAGMHIIEPTKQYGNHRDNKRRCERKRRVAEIRARLLAGERPKLRQDGRGRPPVLWRRIAKELGINLEAAQ